MAATTPAGRWRAGLRHRRRHARQLHVRVAGGAAVPGEGSAHAVTPDDCSPAMGAATCRATIPARSRTTGCQRPAPVEREHVGARGEVGVDAEPGQFGSDGRVDAPGSAQRRPPAPSAALPGEGEPDAYVIRVTSPLSLSMAMTGSTPHGCSRPERRGHRGGLTCRRSSRTGCRRPARAERREKPSAAGRSREWRDEDCVGEGTEPRVHAWFQRFWRAVIPSPRPRAGHSPAVLGDEAEREYRDGERVEMR